MSESTGEGGGTADEGPKPESGEAECPKPSQGMAPDVKPLPRVYVFIDGQNLFSAAKRSFGYRDANYDPLALAKLASTRVGGEFKKAFFYTGVPPARVDAYRHQFWTLKLRSLRRQGVACFDRELKYRRKEVTLDSGAVHQIGVTEEKGIDVKIAVDIMKFSYTDSYDIGIVFSQDNDLMPAFEHVKELARDQKRWIKFVSAYPFSDKSDNDQGIRDTDWMKIFQEDYAKCLDPYDYHASVTKALRHNQPRRR